MSVMDRLKAIRGRLGATPTDDSVPAADAASAGATWRAEAGAAAGTRQAVSPPGHDSPRHVVSMWDLAGDTGEGTAEDPAPQAAPAPALPPRPFAAPPAFPSAAIGGDAEARGATRGEPWPKPLDDVAPGPLQTTAPGPSSGRLTFAADNGTTLIASPGAAPRALPDTGTWPVRAGGAPGLSPGASIVASPGSERGDAGSAPAARSGRVKTRLLGFEHSNGKTTDIFARQANVPGLPEPRAEVRFPVGWLVVVDGPGRGAFFALGPGVAQIGRDEGQAIQLDLGDTSISRTNHASIAFDEEARSFFVGHGGKSNMVRLNGRPLLATERLGDGDELRIGETTLRLVALCGEAFSWGEQNDPPDAANG